MSKPTQKTDDMATLAHSCIEVAKSKGADECSARAYRVREVELRWRDGKVEKVQESTTRGVVLQLFTDKHYTMVSTSDLRKDALASFIGDAIAVARALEQDPHRALPDPELYKGMADADLKVEDPKYDSVTPDQRRQFVKAMEDAARGVKGHEAILSVSTDFTDTLAETFLVNSNGFSGKRRETSFFVSANVSVKDSDGRRPEEYSYAGSRHHGDLAKAESVGRDAAERAISRLGSKKAESAAMIMAIDNRAAGRMVGFLMAPLSGASLQQKRSFLEGKLDQAIFSERMTVLDDPFVPKGFGSRKFDNEGIVAKPRPIVEKGVLKNYYIDNYYGRKLGVKPNGGSSTNLVWTLGDKGSAELLAEMKDGVLVTGFLGGNSNALTGDFSLGVQGFRVRDGKRAEPIAEMNISGNHLDFWKKLVAVGNDPFPYSTLRTPTLVFEDVSFAGT